MPGKTLKKKPTKVAAKKKAKKVAATKVAAKKQTAKKRPSTHAEYIDAAPPSGRAMLRRLHALLRSVAPKAEQVMKWGTPFFVEPRFLFAFSAHRAHLSFTPTAGGLEPFRTQMAAYDTTREMLKIRYEQTLPEALIRKIAARRVKTVKARADESFW